MTGPPNSLLFCLLISAGILYAGQPDRTTAMKWADSYALAYGVPPELVHAIIEVESAWQPHAVSDKGAAGLMQLMPHTAAQFGVTNRFAPEQNIHGGVAYLARLLQIFHGDLRLVTAAYLTGEDRILSAGLRYSNPEVYRYVTKVARLYRQECRRHIQLESFTPSAPKGGGSP